MKRDAANGRRCLLYVLAVLLLTVHSCKMDVPEVMNMVMLDKDTVSCDSEGIFISIQSSGNWGITLSDKEGGEVWCRVDPSFGSGTNESVALVYTRNETVHERTVLIKVSFDNGEEILKELVQKGREGIPDEWGLVSDKVHRWMELPEVNVGEGQAYVFHRNDIGGTSVRNYSILYDASNMIALWVAYPLCKAYMGSGRTDKWEYDPKIPRKYQPELYKGWTESRTYDRGHQIPSADRNANDGINAQTFYFTNMTAQYNSLNQGVWGKVEDNVRGYCSVCDTVYVVTGPVITTESDPEIEYVTDKTGKKTALPKAYYKVILSYRIKDASYHSIGFWYENTSYPSNRTPQVSDLKPVSEIEQLTGLSFFSNLPENIKKSVKNEFEPSRWGF